MVMNRQIRHATKSIMSRVEKNTALGVINWNDQLESEDTSL